MNDDRRPPDSGTDPDALDQSRSQGPPVMREAAFRQDQREVMKGAPVGGCVEIGDAGPDADPALAAGRQPLPGLALAHLSARRSPLSPMMTAGRQSYSRPRFARP